MTLKKCTVTQLDDVFWRVDCPAPLAPFVVHLTCVDGCARASTFNGRSFWGGTWWQALDALLEENGLTRHDTPETAEARVRAAVDMSEPPLQADLRAILAELDRVRSDRDLYKAGSDVLSKRLHELHEQIGDLTKQRPVDVEAVLAPIRRCMDTLTSAAKYHERTELERAKVCRYSEASIHRATKKGLLEGADHLFSALAEAEEIGRGQ